MDGGDGGPARKRTLVVTTPELPLAESCRAGPRSRSSSRSRRSSRCSRSSSALILVYLAQDALLSIALSAVLVLGLDPPVKVLERRGWGRGRAALSAVRVDRARPVRDRRVGRETPSWGSVKGFVDDLPAYIDKAQHSGVLQDIDKNTDAFKKLESAAADAARNLPTAAAQPARRGRRARGEASSSW